MKKTSIDEIDSLLPQTQCRLCGHNGCRPYASAIVENNESIDRCPPGGISVLKKLAAATGQDPEPFMKSMQQKQLPPLVAQIREAECIGCVKCLAVCPTDAILGASKQMHTVIADACTGCQLCVPACPVDCIDVIEVSPQHKAEFWRERYEKHKARLIHEKTTENNEIAPLEERKKRIAEILARTRKK